jgi:hypothetical protein
MEKIIKIFLMVAAAAALSFAQAADTTAKVDSAAQKVAAPAVDQKKVITNVRPKVPTNWSKVKDLFL